MEEILVSVYVLSLQREFDIKLPINFDMNDAVELIQQSIIKLEDNYEYIENPILCSELGNYIINTKNTVKNSGLTNGCRILLN